jgi:hypothetical protein
VSSLFLSFGGYFDVEGACVDRGVVGRTELHSIYTLNHAYGRGSGKALDDTVQVNDELWR